MTGVLLDVTSEPAKGEMVAWVKRPDGATVPCRFPFAPRFFVAGARARLDDLAVALPLVPGVGDVAFEMHKLGIAGPGRRRVLAVTMRDARRMANVAQMIDAQGSHRDFDLYDVDVRMSQRFLIERGLFPFARLDRDFVPVDDKWEIDYEIPPLRACTVAAHVAGGVAKRPDDRVLSVTVDEATFDGGDEAAILRDAAALVRAKDPDVLYTRGGDRWMLSHLEERARSLGLAAWTLGRGGLADPPAKRGRSFHQYGHIKYRAPTRPLAGRIHIDLDESFFFTETDFAGVADLARISGIPVAELARLEAGTAVTAIQVGEAKRQGRLVPWKKNLPEKPKTLRSLVKADRGGYIFDPRVGLYDDVIELDFASLYPTLIARHNLGSETILCDCCEPSSLPPEAFVPQVGYHVCQRRIGLVPTVLDRLVKRRADLKKLRKKEPDAQRRKNLQGRIDALKWLNVVSFGYQGYKNARFGCIEAHEATCAWARETLLTAAEVAREDGYEVLHGIVDSLWLRRLSPASGVGAEALAQHVERATGIRFEPQGRYKWIVFLPTRASVRASASSSAWPTAVPTRMHDARFAGRIGAPNRFYGCFDKAPDAPSRSQAGQDVDHLADGALKVRGVELRQSSAPRVVVDAQEAALRVLARANDATEFRAAIPRALDAARPVMRRLRDGACTPEELVILVHVTRGVEERTVMTHAFAALKQLQRRGLEVPPGDSIRFVILDAKSRDPETRVREARLLRTGASGSAYDVDAYEALVVRALASLLLPLGYDEARVAEELSEAPRQARFS